MVTIPDHDANGGKMRRTALFIVLIFSLMALLPLSIKTVAEPSKSGLLPLFVEHGTTRFDESTGSVMFDTVTIGQNGRLEIIGVSFMASRIITIKEEPNSSIHIDGTQGSFGHIVVNEGEFNVQIGNLTMGRADIMVGWSGDYPTTGDKGENSFCRIETLGGGLNVRGGRIEVFGQYGATGDETTWGGEGGGSNILICDNHHGDIDIRGGWIRSIGGAGGGGPSGNVNAGEGGQSDLTIEADRINITSSYLMSYGGKAGPVSKGAIGESGGSSMMRIRSKNGLDLHDTDLISLSGNNTGVVEHPSPSTIILGSLYGMVTWDHDKPEDNRRSTLSYMDTLSLQVDAKMGAVFHEVNMGDVFPTSLHETEISMYWWVDLLVTDDLGSPIKNAIIYYNFNDGAETYPDPSYPLLAGDNGYATLELKANQGEDWRRYRFFAQYGGMAATGKTDVVRFDLNSNRVEEIHIKLADIEVKTDMDAPVLDLWNITGNAFSRTGLPIDSMAIHLDGELVQHAIDISMDQEDPFSQWTVPLDTSVLLPRTYIMELFIDIGEFTTKMNWTLELSREFFNHPPLIERTRIISTGMEQMVRDEVLHQVHITPVAPEFYISLTILEKDYDSELLKDGEGKWLSSISLRVMMYGHTMEVYSKTLELTSFDADEEGRYHLNFRMDTSRRKNSFDPWPTGKYLVIFIAEDEAGATSEDEQFLIDLHVDQPPILLLRAGKEDPVKPEPHPQRSEEYFSFNSPQGHDKKVHFDLTGCKDIDDPGYFPHPMMDRSWMNLTTTVTIRSVMMTPVKVLGPFEGAPGFDHTFDLANLLEGDVILFEITLNTEDRDGIKSELVVLAQITITAPEEEDNPPGLLFWTIVAMVWLAAVIVAFLVILPIYTKRRTDRVRKLLKDSTLKVVTKEAMKGEKPSNYTISREKVVKGIIEKVEDGKIPRSEYEHIGNDITTAQEKVSIISDKSN